MLTSGSAAQPDVAKPATISKSTIERLNMCFLLIPNRLGASTAHRNILRHSIAVFRTVLLLLIVPQKLRIVKCFCDFFSFFSGKALDGALAWARRYDRSILRKVLLRATTHSPASG